MTSTGFDTTLSKLGIARSGNGASTAKEAGGTNGSFSQSQFLTLLTTQLKNQDPTAPADTNQLVSQMAEITSASGVSEMNATLKSIAGQLGNTGAADALGFVGRTVLTEGSTAYARASGGIAGAVELDGAATNVTVTIEAEDGRTLKTLDLGAQPAGTLVYDWDGTTDGGTPAGSGPFKVHVRTSGTNASPAARSLVWAPVAAVSVPPGGAPLLDVLGIGPVPAGAVRKIS